MRKGKKTFETLRHDILDQAMLRRTKQERNKDNLTREEHDRYKSLYMESCVKLDTFVQAGTLLHNDAHIFDLLTSLRRAVDHPYLIVYGGTLLRLDAHIFDLLTSLRRAVDHPYLIVYGGAESNHMLPDGSRLTVGKAKEFCALCQDDIDDDGEEPKRVSKCWHAFHDQCIREYMQEAPKLKCGGIGCPSCYTKLTIDLGNENDLDSEDEGGKNKKRKASSSGSGSTPKKARVGLRAVADVTPTKGKAPAKAQGVLALPAPPTWIPSKSGEGNSKGARGRAADQKMKVRDPTNKSENEGVAMAIHTIVEVQRGLLALYDKLGAMAPLLEAAQGVHNPALLNPFLEAPWSGRGGGGAVGGNVGGAVGGASGGGGGRGFEMPQPHQALHGPAVRQAGVGIPAPMPKYKAPPPGLAPRADTGDRGGGMSAAPGPHRSGQGNASGQPGGSGKGNSAGPMPANDPSTAAAGWCGLGGKAGKGYSTQNFQGKGQDPNARAQQQMTMREAMAPPLRPAAQAASQSNLISASARTQFPPMTLGKGPQPVPPGKAAAPPPNTQALFGGALAAAAPKQASHMQQPPVRGTLFGSAGGGGATNPYGGAAAPAPGAYEGAPVASAVTAPYGGAHSSATSSGAAPNLDGAPAGGGGGGIYGGGGNTYDSNQGVGAGARSSATNPGAAPTSDGAPAEGEGVWLNASSFQ